MEITVLTSSAIIDQGEMATGMYAISIPEIYPYTEGWFGGGEFNILHIRNNMGIVTQLIMKKGDYYLEPKIYYRTKQIGVCDWVVRKDLYQNGACDLEIGLKMGRGTGGITFRDEEGDFATYRLEVLWNGQLRYKNNEIVDDGNLIEKINACSPKIINENNIKDYIPKATSTNVISYQIIEQGNIETGMYAALVPYEDGNQWFGGGEFNVLHIRSNNGFISQIIMKISQDEEPKIYYRTKQNYLSNWVFTGDFTFQQNGYLHINGNEASGDCGIKFITGSCVNTLNTEDSIRYNGDELVHEGNITRLLPKASDTTFGTIKTEYNATTKTLNIKTV